MIESFRETRELASSSRHQIAAVTTNPLRRTCVRAPASRHALPDDLRDTAPVQ